MMRLYIIKRKSDKKFLRSLEAYWSVNTGQNKTAWSDKPQMLLRSPDGVAKNLRKLCSVPTLDRTVKWPEIEWSDFDASKLELYEVVSMDVDVIAMTATPATSFAQIEKIESIPISRQERRAAGIGCQ